MLLVLIIILLIPKNSFLAYSCINSETLFSEKQQSSCKNCYSVQYGLWHLEVVLNIPLTQNEKEHRSKKKFETPNVYFAALVMILESQKSQSSSNDKG